MTELLGRIYSWFAFIPKITVANVLEILLISFLIYKILTWIQNTKAWTLLKGGLFIIGFYLLAVAFHFNTITWIISNMGQLALIALLIIFQPELRKALEQLGRGTKLEHHKHELTEDERIIEELTSCLTNLSRRRVGALIVIEGKTGLQDVMETGTKVDATISAALLENIFEPNTPLHDGAVIIRDTRVASAACVLNLSDSQGISASLGTRHRAGLGISETTDATVLIVSEETGIISMARDGRLVRYLDEEKLKDILSKIYKESTRGSSFLDKVQSKLKLKGRGDSDNAEQ